MAFLGTYLLIYGIVALGHIALQMLLGHLEHRRQGRLSFGTGTPSVTVVVPAYNEDPALLHRCLRSIDRQDYPGLDVVLVDDGSLNLAELIPVHDEFSHGRFRVVRRPENTGKRNCQAVVFEQTQADIVVTVDSDTVLEPDAIKTIVRRFGDRRVGAVTGNVEVINKGQNLLTRLISYRYWMAFNQERAAQSRFGVVMCASGPFSAYRRTIIDQVRESYVSQQFLGEACTFGDDRHLTNLVLALGHRVVYDEAAVAHTMAPTTIRAYLCQQVRWNKSFYREILWTARFAHRRHAYLSLDLLLQTLMPFALVGALVATAIAAVHDPSTAWRYGAVVVGIGVVRSLYGLLRTRSPGFLLFVCYGFIHVFLLIPCRLYSLATIGRVHWGTRPASSDAAQEAHDARLWTLRSRSQDGMAAAQAGWSRDIGATIADGDAFLLHWQPVRHLWSGTVTHAELLLRLRFEDHVLPPAGFLAIAEQNGLMPGVDEWVVSEAISMLARRAGRLEPLRLEVNVSGASMRNPGFTALLGRRLGETRTSPRNLVLSIPESAAIADPAAAEAFARRVRALGCLVAIDDFGASPAEAELLLRRLPVDYVKLDGSLVRSLPTSAKTRAALGGILSLTRAHGVETIAVFVGDEATIRALEGAGVDYAQGFHVGIPMAAETPLVGAGHAQVRPREVAAAG
jgi:hyaluronan synthase